MTKALDPKVRITASLLDRAHREAGERKAAGDRKACATSVIHEWIERGSVTKAKS